MKHHPTMQGKCHHMIVNVSPIDRGHALFVPEPESCLPQVSHMYFSASLGLAHSHWHNFVLQATNTAKAGNKTNSHQGFISGGDIFNITAKIFWGGVPKAPPLCMKPYTCSNYHLLTHG